MNDIQEVAEAVKDIAPWDSVTDPEGRLLYRLAQRCKNGCIVEIGSWKGRSTIWLARGSQAGLNKAVYAIDPHIGTPTHEQYGNEATLDEFVANIASAGVLETVTPYVTTSEEASKGWKEAVELLFIDGRHDYTSVLFDFLSWTPYLVPNGIVALHDTVGYDGPHRVALEHLFASHKFAHVGICRKIAYARKVSHCGSLHMAQKRAVCQLWRAYAHAYNKAAKVKCGKLQ